MILYQKPNASQIIAIISWAAYLILRPYPLKWIALVVAVAATVKWSYGELRYGVNWFRRLLGLVAAIGLVTVVVLIITAR